MITLTFIGVEVLPFYQLKNNNNYYYLHNNCYKNKFFFLVSTASLQKLT